MFFAACLPACIAEGATPGISSPSCSKTIRSPTAATSGWPGTRQVGLDPDAAGLVARGAERFAQRRGGDPGGPDHGPGLDPIVADVDTLIVDPGGHRVQSDLDAEGFELPLGRLGELGRIGGQHAIAPFDQDDAGLGRIDLAEVTGEGLPGDLRERPGQLDPRRTAADHHERQVGPTLRRVVHPLGDLEGREDPAADLQGVLDALEARREPFPIVVAEIGMPGAGGDNQGIVGDLPLIEQDATPLEVDRPGLGHQDADVLRPPDDPSVGIG